MSSSQFTFLEKGKLKEQIKWMIMLNYQFVSNIIKSNLIWCCRFLSTKRNRRMNAKDQEVKMRIGEVIDKKAKLIKAGDNHARNDFLGILVDSGLSKSEITNEVKLVCFAGEETTASLLVWTMILLSRHPEWQQRARDEVLETFGDKEPDYDGLSKLKIVSLSD